MKLNDESIYALLLARREKHSDFGDGDLAILRAAMRLLGTAVIRHYRDFHSRWQERQQLRQLVFKQAVDNFDRSALTNRECQVAQMILHGHTARETASQLGITPATVKLHRRHIYSKLDVTSQSALFHFFSTQHTLQKVSPRIL